MTTDMTPSTAKDLQALVAGADDVQFEIHGTMGEWYLRVFELQEDEIGKSSIAGMYVLSDEAGQPKPYAQLEALIGEMNRATGSAEYDFAVYQYPDHGHSPGDAAPVLAEPSGSAIDTLAAIELRSYSPDGSRYPSTGISPEEIETLKAARLALAELLQAAEPFATAWHLRAQRPAQTSGNKVRERRDLEAGFYSVMKPDGERFLLTGYDLKRLGEAFVEAAEQQGRGALLGVVDCVAIMELYDVAYSEGQVPGTFNPLLEWISATYPALFDLPEFRHLPRQ